MKDLTWPSAFVLVAAMAAIVGLYGLSDDAATRAKLVDYFDAIIPFLVGAAAGGAAGTGVGYARARKLYMKSTADNVRPAGG